MVDSSRGVEAGGQLDAPGREQVSPGRATAALQADLTSSPSHRPQPAPPSSTLLEYFVLLAPWRGFTVENTAADVGSVRAAFRVCLCALARTCTWVYPCVCVYSCICACVCVGVPVCVCVCV